MVVGSGAFVGLGRFRARPRDRMVGLFFLSVDLRTNVLTFRPKHRVAAILTNLRASIDDELPASTLGATNRKTRLGSSRGKMIARVFGNSAGITFRLKCFRRSHAHKFCPTSKMSHDRGWRAACGRDDLESGVSFRDS